MKKNVNCTFVKLVYLPEVTAFYGQRSRKRKTKDKKEEGENVFNLFHLPYIIPSPIRFCQRTFAGNKATPFNNIQRE